MMRRYGQRQQDDLITASEVAAFAYCPEEWRLEYGLGLPAGNQAAREAGMRIMGGRRSPSVWQAAGS